MIKHEWRKKEKSIYLPKAKPVIIDVPEYKFITIKGTGSPDSPLFTECIGALYSLAYTIKMTLKKVDNPPQNYCDYTVYPLEGVWDINDDAKKQFTGTINKKDLVYKIMLRQPDFITDDFYHEMLDIVKHKKPSSMLEHLKFETINEGKCIQMLHVGKFENEADTFTIMEEFTKEQGLTRLSKVHREIYLSDFRKVEEEKLKTVLRFKCA